MASNSAALMQYDKSKGMRQRNLSNLKPVMSGNSSFKKFRNTQSVDAFKTSRSRNPRNLHVIYSFDNITPMQQTVLEPAPCFRTTGVETHLPTIPQMDLQHKYASAKMRKRRDRRRSRRYRSRVYTNSKYKWSASDHKVPEPKELPDEIEEASDVLVEEGDFEEVEVASTEDCKEDSRKPEIPVGFRRYKVRYLAYKKNVIFRPKFYHLSHQRTIVNCLNLQDDESVEMDVVSEADYDPENSCTEKPEVDLGLIEVPVNDEIPDEDLTEIDTCDEENARPLSVENEETQKFKRSAVSCLPHTYKKTDFSQELNSDIFQGPSVIQELLDAWNSHLIGLEYVLEIRVEKGVAKVGNYHCILCCTDLSGKDSVNVIDHVVSMGHVIKYLDRHFSSSGYKFSDCNSSEILLQRYCEELNRALGFNYMCITYNDYFMKHKKYVEDMVKKFFHPSDSVFGLNFSSYMDVPISIIDCINEMLTGIVHGKSGAAKSTIECRSKLITPTKGKVMKEVGSSSNVKSAPKEMNVVDVNQTTAKAGIKNESKTVVKQSEKYVDRHSHIKPSNSKMRSYLLLKKADGRKQLSTGTSNDLKESHGALQVIQPVIKDFGVKSKTNLTTEISPKKLHVTESLNTSLSGSSHNLEGQEPKKKSMSIASENKLVSQATPDKLLSQAMQSKSVTKVTQKKTEPMKKEKIKTQANQKVSTKKLVPEKIPGKIPVLGTQKKIVHVLPEQKVVPPMSQKKIMPQITPKRTVVQKKQVPQTALMKNVRQVVQIPAAAHAEAVVQKAQTSDNNIEVVVLKEIVSSHSRQKERVVPSDGPTSEDKSIKVKAQQKTMHSKHCLKRVLAKTTQAKTESSSSLKDMDKALIKITVENEKAKLAPKKVVKSEGGVVKVKVDNSKSAAKVSRNRAQSPKRIVAKRTDRRSPVSLSKRRSESPSSKSSRSPSFLSKNSSLERRLSRSPVRYKSPLRLPLTRQYSRSPVRHSLRKHSRSPYRKNSRSPHRRQSRSPRKWVSRSPRRRLSRSPRRRVSRSPRRRRSRSPRIRSRSPRRRYSRSPKRHSRSPRRRHSRSPRRRFSRSPPRSSPRSPPNMRSRSPYWNSSRSPIRLSHSDSSDRKFEEIYDSKSPTRRHLESLRRLGSMQGMYSSNSPNKKYMGNVSASSSSIKTQRNYNPSMNFQGQFSKRIETDLDPISDEDESIYFNTSDKRSQPQSQMVLLQVLQKLSMPNLNLDDPLVQKYLKFAEAHRSELNELLSHDITPSFSSSQFGNLFHESNSSSLQHRMSNLVPGLQMHSSVLPSSNTPFLPGLVQTSSRQSIDGPRFSSLGNMSKAPFEDPLSGRSSFSSFGHEHHASSSGNQFGPLFHGRSKVPAEVMFRDLQAKVNKLFGPRKDEPEPERTAMAIPDPAPPVWDRSQPIGMNVFQQKEGPRFTEGLSHSGHESSFFSETSHAPPPDAKVVFCETSRSSNRSLFPVVCGEQDFDSGQSRGKVTDRKYSLAQRLASILIKVGMIDVPAPLLQEMLMKIGAFSSCPPQDIPEGEIVSILKKLGYLGH